MSMTDESDAALLQGLIHDPDTAYVAIFATYDRQLYSYILNKIKDHQGAEDIVQESWLKVFPALDRFSEEKLQTLKLRSWLFAIVKNEYYDYLKVKKRAVLVSTEKLLNEGLECGWDAQPDEDLNLVELVDDVKAAIDQLPPDYQIVLTLYLLDHLNYQEIARLRHEDPGTIRTRISRGLAMLRKKLGAPTRMG